MEKSSLQYKKLDQAFSAAEFNKLGTLLVKTLTAYLENVHKNETPVNTWTTPEAELTYWSQYSAEKNIEELFKDLIQRSMHVHHPHYIGHQVATTLPIAALSNVLTGLLNNGMAIYEMGAAASALEKIVCEKLAAKIGFNQGTGLLTSGGTLANLTALLSARSNKLPKDVWQEGHQEKFAVIVSGEAHYCVDRALRIMGFGDQGIIKVETGADFKMSLNKIKEAHAKAQKNGITVFALVASAPSTSTGMHEDLEKFGKYCKENKLWFHVDGAHGGAAIYSQKYKGLLKGIAQADSVVIDGHKMLMMPGIMTFLLFKNKSDSYQTFNQKAQYLWEDDASEEWFNYGKRTFECTKEMMSAKFFITQHLYGDQLFDDYVTRQYDLAKSFAKLLKEDANFELAVEPDTNIVCFRYIQAKLNKVEIDKLNGSIRKSLLEQNEFYLVQTKLKGRTFLRVTLMNHLTDLKILAKLLIQIKTEGHKLIKN